MNPFKICVLQFRLHRCISGLNMNPLRGTMVLFGPQSCSKFQHFTS